MVYVETWVLFKFFIFFFYKLLNIHLATIFMSWENILSTWHLIKFSFLCHIPKSDLIFLLRPWHIMYRTSYYGVGQTKLWIRCTTSNDPNKHSNPAYKYSTDIFAIWQAQSQLISTEFCHCDIIITWTHYFFADINTFVFSSIIFMTLHLHIPR